VCVCVCVCGGKKVTFALEQDTEAQRGSRGIEIRFL